MIPLILHALCFVSFIQIYFIELRFQIKNPFSWNIWNKLFRINASWTVSFYLLITVCSLKTAFFFWLNLLFEFLEFFFKFFVILFFFKRNHLIFFQLIAIVIFIIANILLIFLTLGIYKFLIALIFHATLIGKALLFLVFSIIAYLIFLFTFLALRIFKFWCCIVIWNLKQIRIQLLGIQV